MSKIAQNVDFLPQGNLNKSGNYIEMLAEKIKAFAQTRDSPMRKDFKCQTFATSSYYATRAVKIPYYYNIIPIVDLKYSVNLCKGLECCRKEISQSNGYNLPLFPQITTLQLYMLKEYIVY